MNRAVFDGGSCDETVEVALVVVVVVVVGDDIMALGQSNVEPS